MQTAGAGEVAGSRVGGLSSRSCEAIRPPLKLQAACGPADGGWRRGPHGAQGAGHSEGGTSRDSEQIASLTARAIQTARATIAIVASAWHDSTRPRFHGSRQLCVPLLSLPFPPALKRILIKRHVSPRSAGLKTTAGLNGNFVEGCVKSPHLWAV